MNRILIVDDSEQARRLLLDFIIKNFQGVQFEFLEANNGLQALEIIETQNVSIVITKIDMPSMGGVSLILNIRKRHGQLPVIALCAHRDESLKARRGGATAVIERCPEEMYGIFPGALKQVLGI